MSESGSSDKRYPSLPVLKGAPVVDRKRICLEHWNTGYRIKRSSGFGARRMVCSWPGYSQLLIFIRDDACNSSQFTY